MLGCPDCRSTYRIERYCCVAEHFGKTGYHKFDATNGCVLCLNPWHDVIIEDKRPPMPANFSWYSICSRHMKFNQECGLCNTGHWVNDELHELSSWLYRENPKLWRKWANRKTKEGEPGHEARHFLEKIFPRLKSRS